MEDAMESAQKDTVPQNVVAQLESRVKQVRAPVGRQS